MNTVQPIQNNEAVEMLLTESGVPCVSIIMPMHRLSPDRRMDKESLTKAVAQAKEALLQKFSNTLVDLDYILKQIDEQVEAIDYTHSKDGIGIFVSPGVSQTVQFPFPVTKKIATGLAFDIRDLLYYKEQVIEYRVLTLSKKHIHLYEGVGEKLEEIRDGNFPVDYIETYEYAKSARSNSFASNIQKDFERDKSILQEIRLTDFLRTVDQKLDKYDPNQLPLIISGGKKEIADFLKISAHSKKVIGKVAGNYSHNGDMQLAALSWKSVKDYLQEKKEEQLRSLHELIGKKKIAIGLEEVWRAATAGNGQELFVEKDFEYHAFLINEKNELRLTKPANNKRYNFVHDTVERIIKMVKEKKGKVTFTENGALSYFNGIALKLRYAAN